MKAVCLDTSVLVKLLVDEEGSAEAASLVTPATRLVGPPFVWAEVGTVLREKIRQGFDAALANEAWLAFLSLRITAVDGDLVAGRAWEIAELLGDVTLYDASFVAAAEHAPFGPCELVTADRLFCARAQSRYPFVRLLA